jgi:hydroxymethylbilane synthase
MWQSEWVRDRLAAAWPDRRFEIVKIETVGDKVLDRPLPEIGGKGLFTEELESALRSRDVDLAVHSLKDLPTDLAAGLTVGAVCEREDPRDAWVSASSGAPDIAALPPGARIGTSSERRRALALAARPDVQVMSIRGNVETRLRKLEEGQYDAVIMAAAGLLRLGLAQRITSFLEPPEWLSAPGQGAVAVESREGDTAIDELLRPIDDDAARAETTAERTLLARLQGGCQVPVGARAWSRGEELAGELGVRVAEEMLGRGGEAIVATFREPANGG